MLAGAHVELPAVPRTGHNRAGETAFAQRAALMRTDAVERVERAFDVEQRDDSPSGYQLQRTSRRTIGRLGYRRPFSHYGRLRKKFERTRRNTASSQWGL